MNIDSLSFSGGALKGISFIGALKWLELNSILQNVKFISGTSVGAVFGLMVSLGYTYREVQSIILKLDFYRLEDIELNTFFEEYGVAVGVKIENFIKAILKKKGFSKDITFAELHAATGLTVSFLCCKLNDCSQVVFNHENTPNFKVSTACKISMSIPILWKCNKVGDDYLVDGCFSRNLPIHLHDPKTTLGFYLLSPDNPVAIASFTDYILQINSSVFKKGQVLEIENSLSKGYIFVQLTSNGSSIDMSREEKTRIIDRGYDECVLFFDDKTQQRFK
jgi:hypothetical protein